LPWYPYLRIHFPPLKMTSQSTLACQKCYVWGYICCQRYNQKIIIYVLLPQAEVSSCQVQPRGYINVNRTLLQL
jgi:hypothetical protein